MLLQYRSQQNEHAKAIKFVAICKEIVTALEDLITNDKAAWFQNIYLQCRHVFGCNFVWICLGNSTMVYVLLFDWLDL